MKQKNMVLVVVAVGCGLLAAVLTSQMSAGSKRAEPTVTVLVAAKDLPIGQVLKKEDIESYVEVKEFTKATAPALYVGTVEELADKCVTRTIRKGNHFDPQDVSKHVSLSPPPGYKMMAIGCNLEQGVAGFVRPGSKVDVIASIPIKSRKSANGASKDSAAVVPFFVDMLVLAVDSKAQISNEPATAPTMATVSLAVKPEQALLLHGAVSRNSNLRLALRGDSGDEKYKDMPTEKQLWALLGDQADAEVAKEDDGGTEGDPKGTPAAPKEEKVKLAVAKEDLKPGTVLTDDLITEKFEMKEFAKPAPAQGIENLREYKGKTLTSNLVTGQYVPKSFLGEAQAKKAAPSDNDNTQKETAKLPEDKPKVKPEAPPVYHDVVLQTPNGVKKVRYQQLPGGGFKYLGELKHDGSPDPVEPKADDKPKGDPISARL